MPFIETWDGVKAQGAQSIPKTVRLTCCASAWAARGGEERGGLAARAIFMVGSFLSGRDGSVGAGVGGVFEIAEIDREADAFAAVDGFGDIAEEGTLDSAFDGDVLEDC